MPKDSSDRFQLDEQIKWTTDLLRSQNVPYWLDCGTLLHVMRDGDDYVVDPWDDIDVSIWDDHEHRMGSVLPRVREAGYSIRPYYYKGNVYKYRFSSKSYHSRLVGASQGRGFRQLTTIEISVYRRAGEFAWCPETYQINPYALSQGSHVSLKAQLYRWIHHDVIIGMLQGDSRPQVRFIRWWPVNVSFFAWRPLFKVGTFWVPRSYVEETVRLKKYDFQVPRDWDAYLQYRYRDWRIPVSEWRYWYDDGSFQRKAPSDIIKTASDG